MRPIDLRALMTRLIRASWLHDYRSVSVTDNGTITQITLPAGAITENNLFSFVIAQIIPQTGNPVQVTDGVTTAFLTDWTGAQVFSNQLAARVRYSVLKNSVGTPATTTLNNFSHQILHTFQLDEGLTTTTV